MMSPEVQAYSVSAGRYVGSMVRLCYDRGHYIPQIVLHPMAPISFITLPLQIGA